MIKQQLNSKWLVKLNGFGFTCDKYNVKEIFMKILCFFMFERIAKETDTHKQNECGAIKRRRFRFDYGGVRISTTQKA
jgi:hypothetical protein